MYKKTIILASAILAVTVMTTMIAGHVFAAAASPPSETFTGGAGGIGGAGGAGGVAGNGGTNTDNSQSGGDNDQRANGGDANGGHGGSANGGNVCEQAKCTS